MNKRARVRLIGVTAIILIAVMAIIFGAGSEDGAYFRQVSEALEDPELVGERIRVGGEVVAGSWDRQSNPMKFDIREEGVPDGPTIEVVYSGGVPSTFGDGVVAIVTGTLTEDLIIDSDDMITKCPSKYESEAGALSIDSLLEKGESMVGNYTKITGIIVSESVVPLGGEARFYVVTKEGGEGLGIFYEGALPAGMDDGSQVVISGTLDEDGIFAADTVALSEESE